MAEVYLQHFIFLGYALAILFGLGHLVRGRHLKSVIVALIFFAVGARQIFFYSLFWPAQIDISWAAWAYVAYSFCLGPLIFLYFKKLLDDAFIFTLADMAHFIPALALFVVSIGNFIDLSSFHKPVQNSYELGGIAWLFWLSAASIYLYLVLTIYRYLKVPKLNNVTRSRLYSLYVIFVCAVTVVCTAVASLIFEHLLLAKLANVMITALLVLVFILGQRDQSLLTDIVIGMKNYYFSHLDNVDIASLEERIEQLEEEKLFFESEIDLKAVATKLGINGHQLSQYLNQNRSMNFNEFINSYRIEEAKRLLVAEKSLSVSNIVFQVGFNSSSVFYTAFKNHTGQSPSDFRKTYSKL